MVGGRPDQQERVRSEEQHRLWVECGLTLAIEGRPRLTSLVLSCLSSVLEWQDLYSDGKRQNSKYSYPVSIALPTAVQLETNVKILEDSGIKNFNLTGLSFNTESGEGRFVYIDFMMYSR